MDQESKVISTQIVNCQQLDEPPAPPIQAVLIVYSDGRVEVRCAYKGVAPICRSGTCGFEKR